MKKIVGLLALVVIFTTSSPQAFGQFCSSERHFPNYMASVDGYAPADYDGDGLADWAIKDFSGAWTIDYSSNGFNGYDQTFFGYGGQSNLPVPHDYDGDGLADLAVKSNTQGSWNIDYASNGFGFWDAVYWGYGGAENRPVPADYDGDGKADLSVKSSTQGRWNIDYAANGYGTWDASYAGYGGAENIPVPAHYANDDLRADLAVWVASGPGSGTFNIDRSANGFGTWDVSFRNILPGPGRPAAGDFNGDTYLDFSVKGDDGVWRMLLHFPSFSGPCNISGFTSFGFQSFAGYGDNLHRPVPHQYSNYFPSGGCCFGYNTDLAVRKESAPTSVAMDFLQNGLGSWDYVYSP